MSTDTENTTQSAGADTDLYNLSDDEFMNLDYEQFENAESQETSVEDVDDEGDAEEDAPAAGEEEREDVTSDTPDEEDTAEDTDEDPETSVTDKEDGDDTEVAEDEDAEKDTDDSAINYESEFKKILAPFKANGKEIQVQSADEAISLMQQGANYNKKMAAMKPHLKTLKVLENNNLLDDEKIGFLIDLANKDQKAIGKLLKDSGIDPLDMDVDASSDYAPRKHSVSDQELALDEVLDEIQDSEHYGETVDLVSQKWDEASKQRVAQEPVLLKVINDHMASGIYGVISQELERQKMLGQLNGLSDLDAYKQVGDSIQARGGFDHLFQQGQAEQGQQNAKPAKRLPPKQKPEDPKLNEKRRAAASTKGTPARQKNVNDFNPLGLSDEEFEKQFNPKLL